VGAPGSPAPAPPKGLPSTSLTSVVVAAENPDSTLQGPRHRHLQLRWWPPVPPWGAHHQRFQLRWWPLPDLSLAPPGSPPSTFSTLVVAAAGPTGSTSYGLRHRCLQLRWWLLPDLPTAPQGGRHRCLQLRWWPLSDLAASTPPGAPPSTSLISVVTGVGPCRQHPPGGPSLTSSTSVVAAAGPCRQHP
jgi:hypothetical protein